MEMVEDEQAIEVKRDRLQQLLLDKIPNLVVNGDMANWLVGNLHISVSGVPNSAIVARVRSKLAICLYFWCGGSFPCASWYGFIE
jgi:cysteine desulfurase